MPGCCYLWFLQWLILLLTRNNFIHFRTVATYCARMGQCFSTSMDAVGIDVSQGASWEQDDDVKTADGKYCFSDGVGTISQELASVVSKTGKAGRRVVQSGKRICTSYFGNRTKV